MAPVRSSWTRRLFLCAYTMSGAAALLYEVAWTRLLALRMGHTVAAASTVFAAFMGGLAVGAWLAGRYLAADSQAQRLKIYAWLELVVAASAILLPAVLSATEPVLSWAYADGQAVARFAMVRVAISLICVGLPAAAMGATFPIASEWLATARVALAPRPAAIDSGILYASNTVGAAVGAIAGGFWLLPAFGIRATTWVGVSLNVAAAVAALRLSTRLVPDAAAANSSAGRTTTRRKRPTPAPPHDPASSSPTIALSVAALSGCVALIYEVAWTRLLSMVLGPTTYAVATMLAGFVAGIACGSAMGTSVAKRTVFTHRALSIVLAVAGAAACVASWYAASRVPLVVASQVADPGVMFTRVITLRALIVGALLLPMTVALGAVFPLALAMLAPDAASVRSASARLYTANTVGAIAGALGAGFFIVPALGVERTFAVAALLCALGSALASVAPVSLRASIARRAVYAAPAVALAAGVLFIVPPWDRELLTSGAYKYAAYLRPGDFDVMLRAGRLVFYEEGGASTVTVRRLAGELSLAIDGKIDGSNSGDMLTQGLLGLLPVLAHDDPKEICIIGLGTGVTARAALARGSADRVDVVEISPQVVQAAALFERENESVLADPAVNVIVADGRSHLLLARQQYDVIISEPSNPWMSGVAALFTREFFAAARSRLKPDGIICQWAHIYDISEDDLRSIVRTFASVFPQATMWLVGEGDLLLIGTNGTAIRDHFQDVGGRWNGEKVDRLLADLRIARESAPFAVFSLYAGGPEEIATLGGHAALQNDDEMALEFSAPRNIYRSTGSANLALVQRVARSATRPPALQALVESATAANWMALGTMHVRAEAHKLAYEDLETAVGLDAGNLSAWTAFIEAAVGAGKRDEALSVLQEATASHPLLPSVRYARSRLKAASGDFEGAVRDAEEAVRLDPQDPRMVEQLASVLMDAGDAERLAPLAARMRSQFPQSVDAKYYHAAVQFLQNRADLAIEEGQALVGEQPAHARAYNLVGAACATMGRHECAVTAFEKSLAINPRDSTTYINLGMVYLEQGVAAEATKFFAEALTLDPESSTARAGLRQAEDRSR